MPVVTEVVSLTANGEEDSVKMSYHSQTLSQRTKLKLPEVVPSGVVVVVVVVVVAGNLWHVTLWRYHVNELVNLVLMIETC